MYGINYAAAVNGVSSYMSDIISDPHLHPAAKSEGVLFKHMHTHPSAS